MHDGELRGQTSNETRLAYLLGAPLADNVVRQWPQMEEVVRGRELVAIVEGNFEKATLEVGRRLRYENVIVVEWSINYGYDRIYRNVTIGELEDGRAVRVTDYWGAPVDIPEWRKGMTERLDMPSNGTWPSKDRLKRY
jgi:hypothetical protein